MKQLQPKTEGQKEYLRALENSKITFCSGVAGTGKTLIATRYGMLQLLENKYSKLIITRPMVQAGEVTGFLPGGINEKMDPYIRPVYDEVKVYLTDKQWDEFIKKKLIEVIPFAYMRGMNFHNAYIIGDELQNCTYDQLKMFITRFGRNSKMVLTGDPAQSDLPKHLQGAFARFADILSCVDGVSSVKLTDVDIVREPIITEILKVLDSNKLSP